MTSASAVSYLQTVAHERGLGLELLPNGLIRVFDRQSKLSACFDGETGAYRHGGLRAVDLHDAIFGHWA